MAEMVIAVGAAGADILVFDNFEAFALLSPHNDKYVNLMLSPVAAAAFDVNDTTIFCDDSSPESIDENSAMLPVNSHNQPVAAPAVVEAAGKFGAE